ncbi:hypothetical protein CN692_07735 [Bacillus sp. AFS002410]|uniref:hypothetical protein n=1 Tax=Bacillus sp. AFS002410 TaxID=2033481 RepID=UPI000BF1AAFA|nr:hypothetical protein [Bacillus sp. AFS002410]PEJ58692.1 hypothetical protein CN692_07735 [Bacillus sp. AFS002410]
MYYNSHDVKEILGFGSLRTAQIRIKAMNDELKGMGYWVERGKVPIGFFHQKYPFIQNPIEERRI